MFQPKRIREPRRTRSHDAWITRDDDFRSYECQVIDVSRGGAKLVANIAAGIGSTFRLSVAPQALVRKRCEVVWRKGRQFGVKFIDAEGEPPPV